MFLYVFTCFYMFFICFCMILYVFCMILYGVLYDFIWIWYDFIWIWYMDFCWAKSENYFLTFLIVFWITFSTFAPPGIRIFISTRSTLLQREIQEARFWGPNSNFHFFPEISETSYTKVNVHKWQSGLGTSGTSKLIYISPDNPKIDVNP